MAGPSFAESGRCPAPNALDCRVYLPRPAESPLGLLWQRDCGLERIAGHHPGNKILLRDQFVGEPQDPRQVTQPDVRIYA